NWGNEAGYHRPKLDDHDPRPSRQGSSLTWLWRASRSVCPRQGQGPSAGSAKQGRATVAAQRVLVSGGNCSMTTYNWLTTSGNWSTGPWSPPGPPTAG